MNPNTNNYNPVGSQGPNSTSQQPQSNPLLPQGNVQIQGSTNQGQQMHQPQYPSPPPPPQQQAHYQQQPPHQASDNVMPQQHYQQNQHDSGQQINQQSQQFQPVLGADGSMNMGIPVTQDQPTTMAMPQQQQYEQQFAQEQSQQPPQQQEQTPSQIAASAAEGVQQKLKGLIKQAKEHTKQKQSGPNLGFKPTAALAQRHEDSLVSGKRPLFQFQVTKLRTWRTGYTRLLCLYDDHLSTVDPDSHQVTNTWSYGLLTDFMAVEKDQFLLQVKTDKLKFQCHNVDRSLVLTALLQCKDEFDENSSAASLDNAMTPIMLCNRWTRQGYVVPSALRVTPYALVEIHPVTKKRIQYYRFIDIAAISFLSDDPSGILLHLNTRKSRLFCISNKSRSDLVMMMRQNQDRIGLELHMTDSCTLQQWKDRRREEQRPRKSSPIATEWQVTKQSKRHDTNIVGTSSGISWPGGVISRRLCITGTGQVLEMDTSGMIVSVRPLSELYAIVRPFEAGDTFFLEYADGRSQKYSSKTRDSLLVSLLDAATTLGRNPKVHVSDVPSGGYCLASFSTLTTPEKSGGLFQPISIPIHCLKRVHTVGTSAFSYMNSHTESSTEEGVPINPIDECRNVVEICREFNASVLPTAEGLPPGEKDKQVLGSIGSLWGLVAWLLEYEKDRNLAEQTAGPILQTLHRLSKTPAGYKNTIELATFLDSVPLLLTIEDAFSKFWAFRTLTVLLSGQPGKMRDKEIEYVNKSVIFKAGGSQLVHGLVLSLLDQTASDLIRMVMSDILQSILCSFADTTSPELFAMFMQALGENYTALLNTLYQQTPFVLENSALLLHLLNTHAPVVAAAIREAALASGILLHHFHAAIFSPMAGQRFLSRFLCSLWLSGPMDCDEKKLLKRIVPRGFIPYLKMPPLSRTEEEQLDAIEQDVIEENIPEENDQMGVSSLLASLGTSQPTGAAGTNTARLRSRIALAEASSANPNAKPQRKAENFRIFFHTLTQDHSLPDLIWNQQTRRELRIGLESEIQYIHRETESRGIDMIAWNHQQFGIEYPSLEGELKVGTVYMRLWLQAGEGFIKTWDEPNRLFELLFRRFLCEMDRNAKVTVMCIRCLERLYAIHGVEIGSFPDVMILIRSMASTRNVETQHRLLGLLATILGVRQDDAGDENRVNVPENAEQLLNIESIEQLCQFVAWGHTNGVQVGNLMTSLLDSAKPKSALLTDGSEMRPDGHGKASSDVSSSRVPMTSCPRVWFVATTHRIPPPADTVRGPFQVSELQKMIETGEISPFTLVTSSHVESYDEEDDGTSLVQEAQIDTGKWRRLDQIWQLRWQLCTDGNDTGIYSPSEVALQALLSLTRLVDLHRSLDSRGLPYYPIPIAKRIICGLSKDPFSSKSAGTMDRRLSFLSILAQSILCNDSNVVDQAANLLYKLTQHNEEATSKLYLTGVFFFMACYTGSNFHALAKLMHATHLKQHFRSGYAAAAKNEEILLKERSILGTLLPEGVLHILLNYNVVRFNDVFVGNYDTPEVIWNLEMRKHLIEMVRQHLGDFPKRLMQNTTTQYEYCPIPGIAYKRLEKEIFCHNYYLSNLCDESRFPNWPISEPVEVFRASLEEFKKQMNRDEEEEGEAIQKATKVLNLKSGDGSKELRKAYRVLARKYHPDKNPGGREMFEAIQGAYELLLPVVESGGELSFIAEESADGTLLQSEKAKSSEGFAGGRSQMDTLHLLIKTQILICRRFEMEMGKYKYPAYKLLLSNLELSKACKEARKKNDEDLIFSSPFFTEGRALFVKDCAELVFRTCLVSPLNAEELVSESGVVILNSGFDFYVYTASILDKRSPEVTDTASDGVIFDILSNIVHTIAGIAYYESGRSAIESLPDLPQFCMNWRRCLDGRYLMPKSKKVNDSSLKKFALEGVANMSRSSILQNQLISCGIVWPLVRFLLGYDPTLDDAIVSHQNLDDDVGISQASSNALARLATRALGMLSGYLLDPKLATPENKALQACLRNLFTSPIALLFRNKRTGEILRTLNTNVESPSRIWNTEMRGELMKKIAAIEEKRQENVARPLNEEFQDLADFGYATLKNEMQIGGVYVRVFNKLGLEKGGLREITNPTVFAKQLIFFVAKCINESSDVPKGWIEIPVSEDEESCEPTLNPISTNDRRFVMVITALRLIARAVGPIDELISEPSTTVPSVLLSLLELQQDSEAFEIGSDILSTLCSKQGFADAVARQGALWRLLCVLERTDGSDDKTSVDHADQASGETGNDMLRKQRGWTLLESLSSSPSVAQKIVESSAWLELLGILIGYHAFTKVWIARVGAAKTLSRLLWDPKTGQSLAPLLERFLPLSLVVVLKEEGSDTMLSLFDGESDTPELIWDGSMRGELRKVANHELDAIIDARHGSGQGMENLHLEPSVRVKYTKLQNELFVGGVYVTRFLKEPTYNVRDPTSFLEMLLQRWTHELQLYTQNESKQEEKHSTDITAGGQDHLQSVTDAIVYLCKIRSNICDKLSQWGYMSRCLSFLDNILSRDMFGTQLLSVMRILHVAVGRRSNVESLIASGSNDRVHGIVAFTMRAVGDTSIHPDAGFMLEMLKKVFVEALGDVNKTPKPITSMANQSFYNHGGNYAMAPSPAPGEGRVRVNMGDDPLGLGSTMSDAGPPPLQQNPSLQVNPQLTQSRTSQYQRPNDFRNAPNQLPSNQTNSSQNFYGTGFQQQPSQQQAPYSVVQQQYSQSAYGSSMNADASHQNSGGWQVPITNTPFQQGYNMQNSSQQFPQQNLQQRNTPSSYAERSAMAKQLQGSQPMSQNIGISSQQNSQGSSMMYGQNETYLTSRQLHQAPNAQAQFQVGSRVNVSSEQIRYGGNHSQAQYQSQYNQQASNEATQGRDSTSLTRQDMTQQPYEQRTKAFSSQIPKSGHQQYQNSSFQAQQTQYQQPKVHQTQSFNESTQPSLTAGNRNYPQDMTSQSQYYQQPNYNNPTFQQDNSVIVNTTQQLQQSQPYQQLPGTFGPSVETVTENENQLPSSLQGSSERPQQVDKSPEVIEGSGIDARTKPEPSAEAAQRAATSQGAPGCADGRKALLESALLCDLPSYLLETVLENPGLSRVKDSASVKVHAVELLKLLTKDPGYGMKIQLILEKNPAWKKYVSQDHSLFITGPEQKTDYFLTDGNSSDPKKLLTQG